MDVRVLYLIYVHFVDGVSGVGAFVTVGINFFRKEYTLSCCVLDFRRVGQTGEGATEHLVINTLSPRLSRCVCLH